MVESGDAFRHTFKQYGIYSVVAFRRIHQNDRCQAFYVMFYRTMDVDLCSLIKNTDGGRGEVLNMGWKRTGCTDMREN